MALLLYAPFLSGKREWEGIMDSFEEKLFRFMIGVLIGLIGFCFLLVYVGVL
jgi:hypothetical protein